MEFGWPIIHPKGSFGLDNIFNLLHVSSFSFQNMKRNNETNSISEWFFWNPFFFLNEPSFNGNEWHRPTCKEYGKATTCHLLLFNCHQIKNWIILCPTNSTLPFVKSQSAKRWQIRRIIELQLLTFIQTPRDWFAYNSKRRWSRRQLKDSDNY